MDATAATDPALAPVRSELRGFAGYRSARMEAADGRVWLNANESPWPSTADPQARAQRYPEPQPRALLDALARCYGVSRAQLLACRGSDEGVDLLVRACCRAGRDAVLVTPPTFGMYAVCARLQDAAVVELPLHAARDWRPDPADIVAAVQRAPVTVVFLCSPNNPVGGAVAVDTIAQLARSLRGRALLVVDEAYAEFAHADGAIGLLPQHPNLVVLRTLSKAHALAGARIGCVLAAPALVDVLRRIQAPYPVPAPSMRLALRALLPDALVATRARVQTLVAAREALRTSLTVLPAVREVLPGEGNFLTVRFADGRAALRALGGAGVVVRDVSGQYGLEECLRISVGTSVENAALLGALGADRGGAVAPSGDSCMGCGGGEGAR